MEVLATFGDKFILFSPCIFLTVEGILQWKLLLINETHGKYSYHYLQGFIRLKWCRISAINSRCCFQIFFISPLPGEMIQVDEHIFQMGWNHQLEKNSKKTVKNTSGYCHQAPVPDELVQENPAPWCNSCCSSAVGICQGWRGWQFLKRRKQFCKLLQYPFHFHFPNFFLLSNDCFSCFIYIKVVALHEISVEHIAVGHQSTSSELHQRKRYDSRYTILFAYFFVYT